MTYLSGPISHPDPKIQRKQHRRFFQVAKKFPGCYNPALHEKEYPELAYEGYLALDVIWIVQNKPTMYMMKGWEESGGARLEHAVATWLGLKIEYEIE